MAQDPINDNPGIARSQEEIEAQIGAQLPDLVANAQLRADGELETDPVVITVARSPEGQDFGFGSLGTSTFGTADSESQATFGLASFAEPQAVEGIAADDLDFGGVLNQGPEAFTTSPFTQIQPGPLVGVGGDNFTRINQNLVGGNTDFTEEQTFNGVLFADQDPTQIGGLTSPAVPTAFGANQAPQPVVTDDEAAGGFNGRVIEAPNAGADGTDGTSTTDSPLAFDPSAGTGSGVFGNITRSVSSLLGPGSQSSVSAPKDWRFKISLLPGSDVLYKDTRTNVGGANILTPLVATDGVVFPYTPNVLVNYRANYDKLAPTHSNFPSWFYQSSEVSDVQINATFTAQSIEEADYMMAMIHFFRSATKMFYGQDTNRGAPPPLVAVTGFGQHQFNNHKAVISQFNYSLPDNVDYIRTSQGGVGSIQAQQTRGQLASGNGDFGIFGIASRIGRLLGIGLDAPGAEVAKGFAAANEGTDLARGGANYVPTKMEVSLVLLPVVTRAEQSKNYSTKLYGRGDGVSQRGHW